MRLPPLPPASPRHRQEQIKLAARGLQTLAVIVLVVVLAGSALSPALAASRGQQLAGVLLAVALIGLGLIMLRYMPIEIKPGDRSDDR